jgi:transcriptional regulator with XRE-family HTH domain
MEAEMVMTDLDPRISNADREPEQNRGAEENQGPDGTQGAEALGHKLRLRRKVRNMSLKDVAGRSGVSVALLSQIERGMASPSLRSLRVICAALDMPMGWLFDSEHGYRPEDDGIVVRRSQRRRLDLSGKGMVKELLTPDNCPTLQMMEIVINPGGGSGEKPFNGPEGAKCGTVLEGTLGLEVDQRQHFLAAGDSFAFDAQRMMRFWCATQEPCRVIWVVTPAVY